MSLLLIITVILVGILFIFVEFFFIPGISIFSLLGFIVSGIGVYLSYHHYGQTTGNWMFIGAIVALGVIMYWGYKRTQSRKWALKTEIDGKVNVENYTHFAVGDRGISYTNLRPEGKAIFQGDDRITVYSIGEFIDKDKSVQIVRIDHNKIYVKQID